MFFEYEWGLNDWHVHSIDFFVLGIFFTTSEWDFAQSLTKTCTAAFIPEEFQSRRLNLQSHTFSRSLPCHMAMARKKIQHTFRVHSTPSRVMNHASSKSSRRIASQFQTCQDQWSCRRADLIIFNIYNIYMTHLSYMCQSITSFLWELMRLYNVIDSESSAHFFLHHWCCNSWWTLRRPWPAWRPAVFGASCGRMRSGLKTRILQCWNGAVFLGEGCFLGGGFKDSLFLPLLGEMIQLDEHNFSDGLVMAFGCWVSGVMMKRPVAGWTSSCFSYNRCLIDWFLEEGFPSHWCHHLRFVVSLSGWWRRTVVLLHLGDDFGEIRTFGWESVRDR